MGGYAGSRDYRSNPEFSEYRVSQCRPSGAFVHDRVPSSRYKGSPVSEFQEILFLNMISAVIVTAQAQRICPSCGNEFSGAMEFCPVCMLRKGLVGGFESGESSCEEAVKLAPDQPPKRFEH